MTRRYIAAIKRLWAEIRIPSPEDEGGYDWSVKGLSHAMLGAALAGALAWGAAAALIRAALAVAYWWIKERGDLRRGGTLRDGLMDAGMVAVGLTYQGPWHWPVMVMAAVAVGAVIVEAKNEVP